MSSYRHNGVYPTVINEVLMFYLASKVHGNRRIFVYIFCVISICALIFTRATKSLVLNIERTSQN